MAPNPPESEYTLKEALTMLVPDPQRNSTAAARRNKKAGGFKLPSLTSRSRSRSPSPSPTISHPSTPYKITGDFKSGASSPAISSPTRSQSPSPSPSAFVSAQASPSESNAASPNMPNAPLPVPATNASLLVPSQSTSKLRRPASQILPTVEPPPVTKDPTKQMKASKEYRTVKEFKGSGADELPLEVGDIVETLPSPPSDKGAGWWYGISRTWGTNNGLKGFFPSDHVVLETFEDLAVQETRLLSTAEPATDDYIEEEFACELPDTVRPGIKLQCVYPYERTKADELEMEYGDVIVVLEAPEGGWWRGMKGFSTKAPTSGWFPCTMVTLAPGENIPGWSPTKIIKKRASEVAPSTVPVAEDQPVEIIPLKEDGEKNASLNEPSENTKSVKSESESSVAHESIREISRDPVIMETLEPPRNPEESGQSIEVTASGLIGLKPKSSNDTDIEVTDSEKTSDAATPSTSTSASRPLSRPVSRPSSRPGSRPGSRPPSRPVSSYVPALLETQSEASSDAMSSDASTNFNVLRTLDTIGITPLINSLDNINPASQPDASANSLLASNFSDAPTKPEIDTKNIIDRSPNAEPESCVPLEKPPRSENEVNINLERLQNTEYELSDSSSDSESPVPPRRIVGDANEGSQPKTVLTKPSRHIRAMSVPASPLGTMTAGSLGPVLDEPEPIEDGDMPRGTSSTTDGVGGVPGERWSYAYSKTGHNRSVSASETDKNSPRLSIISKSFMPHIEGSRTSMAFKKDDDTISIAPSDIHLPETPEAIEAKKNKREKIITELIETEKDYVRDLKIIIDTFMKPMANSKFDKNVDALFSNVDELLSINSEFLRRFEAKQRASPTFIGIGEIFLELGDSFAKYTLYCANHSAALTKLQNLTQTNREFRRFLEDICKNPVTRNLDLGGFLIKPVQRICKYPLLLKEVIKNTPDEHRELPILKLALDTIQAIITQVNDGARAAEGVRKMVEVQNLFTEKLNFITPTRYVLRDDNLNLVGKNNDKKQRKLFLFNDLVIIARKDWQSKLRLIHQVNLRHCRVADIVDDNNDSTSGHMFEVEVIPAGGNSGSAKVRRFLFSCETPKVKTGWIEAYRSVATVSVKKKKLSETVVAGEDGEIEDDVGNTSVSVIDTPQEEVEEEKPMPLHKRLEMYKEEANKALIKEYKIQISELGSKIQAADLAQSELKNTLAEMQLRFDASENKVSELETGREDLKQQLWNTQCSLSEAQALNETLQTNMKETIKQKEDDVIIINVALEEKKMEAETLRQELTKLKTIEINTATMLEKKEMEVVTLTSELQKALGAEKQTKNESEAKIVIIESLKEDIQKTVAKCDQKVQSAIEVAETKITAVKLAAEEQIAQVEQRHEQTVVLIQEEAQHKISVLEAELRREQSAALEIATHKDAAIKEMAHEKAIEKQRLTTEFENLKKKAIAAHENLKRSLAQMKSDLADARKVIKDQDIVITEKDNNLREKENIIAKLDLDKHSLTTELQRNNLNAENSRVEYTRLLANMEKVVQERHQVISRKEAEISDLVQRLAQSTERAKHAEYDAEKVHLELLEKTRHYEEVLAQLREDASKTRAERARESEQLDSLHHAHRDATKQLDALRSQLSGATDANRRLLNDNVKMKDTINTQTSKITVTSHELQDTKLQLSELQDKFRRKTQDLTEITNSEHSLKERLKIIEGEYHVLVVNCERSDSRNIEMVKSIEQKDHEIAELKEVIRKTCELSQAQFHREMNELKQNMIQEAAIRYQIVAKENAELQLKLNREMAELKEKKDHEGQMLAGQLELVERLQKETTIAKTRCEKEIEDLRYAHEKLDLEQKEKVKTISALKKRVKLLEGEKGALEQSLEDSTLKNKANDEQIAKFTISTRALENDLTLTQNKLTATEKEAMTLTNRLDLYNELDKKYLILRDHSDQVSLQVRSKEDHLKQNEDNIEKKDKEIAALEYAVDEISSLIFGIHLKFPDSSKYPAHNTRILAGLSDESKVKSILARINEVSLDHEHLCKELATEQEQSNELERSLKDMVEERQEALVNLKKIESKFKERTKSYKHDVTELEHNIESLKADLLLLKNDKRDTELSLDEVRCKFHTTDADKCSLEKRFQDLLSDHHKLKEKYIHTVDNLKRDLAATKLSLDEAKSHNEAMRLHQTQTQAEGTYLKDLTDSLVHAKVQLQSNLDSVNATAAALGMELDRARGELEGRGQELARAREAIEALEERVARVEEARRRDRGQGDAAVAELRRRLEDACAETRRVEQERGLLHQAAMGKWQVEVETLEARVRQLQVAVEERDARMERLAAESVDLEGRLSNARAENEVLCAEVVECTRRENAMRCRLDAIQCKIVASSQNIEALNVAEQQLLLSTTPPIKSHPLHHSSATPRLLALSPAKRAIQIESHHQPRPNAALVRSTLSLIDGILEKKTHLLRRLASCEKTLLSLLDAHALTPDPTQSQGVEAAGAGAARALEFIANASCAVTQTREGRMILLHRARRDAGAAKEVLYEMHEFVRVWLSGFEGFGGGGEASTRQYVSLRDEVRERSLQSRETNPVVVPCNALLDTAAEGKEDRAEVMHNPLASKTPGILLALPPSLGTLFDHEELSSFLGKFEDTKQV